MENRGTAAPTSAGLVHSLLGHVLAHEITHILQGIDRHSQEGVMKAHWTTEDIVQMARQPLPFEQKDVMLIHRGLERYCPAGATARNRECAPQQLSAAK